MPNYTYSDKMVFQLTELVKLLNKRDCQQLECMKYGVNQPGLKFT